MNNDGNYMPGLGAFGQPQPRLSHVPSPWTDLTPLSCVTHIGRFAPDASLFHDGFEGAPVALQLGASRAFLDVGDFSGSYVSLALDLPSDIAGDLGRTHDLRVLATLATSPTHRMPGGGYLRLSIDDGGTIWHQTVPLFVEAGAQSLALGPGPNLPDPLPYTQRKAWIDLVFTDLAYSIIGIESFTVTRGPMPVL